MKRCPVLVLALALVLLLLCACGGNAAPEPTAQPTAAPTATPEPATSTLGRGLFDSFSAEFVGAESFTDADGGEALRVYFDFVNLSSSAVAPAELLLISAVQDGQTLSWAQSAPDETPSGQDNLSLRLQPGRSARCVLQYKLLSESTVAVLLDDSSGHTVSALLALSRLPGAPESLPEPEEAFSYEPPATELEAAGTLFDLYTAAIVGGEVEPTDEGAAMAVTVEFTNEANPDPVVPFTVYSLSAYQNGVELSAVPEAPLPADAAAGETVSCVHRFVLRDASPVYVELYGFRETEPAAALTIQVEG